MAEEVRRFGINKGLQLELALRSDDRNKSGLAWGEGRLLLQGETVWSQEDEQGHELPLQWSWLDLLEFLGRSWPWLVMEESYPVPVNPLYPGFLRREAERLWEDLSEIEAEKEEETVYRFMCRHDLAMGLKGVFVPSVILLRQGKRCLISSPTTRQHLICPLDETLQALEQAAEYIAGFVERGRDPRAEPAVEQWRRRHETMGRIAPMLRSGLSEQELEEIQGAVPADQFWEIDLSAVGRDTELLAAARMSRGFVTADHRRTVLQRLRQTPRIDASTIENLAARLGQQEHLEDGKPHDQGYRAAEWLRSVLGLKSGDRVDPEDLLNSWGVVIETIELGHCPLDAVAAWGDAHGPVVLLNIAESSKASHEHGRRSSLAHEICHMLLDREGALPAGEVLGGNTPEYPEKRARAFAAEFLLPREMAADAVRQAADIDDAIEALHDRFQVSRELIGRQINNSGIWDSMGRNDQSRVELLFRVVGGIG